VDRISVVAVYYNETGALRASSMHLRERMDGGSEASQWLLVRAGCAIRCASIALPWAMGTCGVAMVYLSVPRVYRAAQNLSTFSATLAIFFYLSCSCADRTRLTIAVCPQGHVRKGPQGVLVPFYITPARNWRVLVRRGDR